LQKYTHPFFSDFFNWDEYNKDIFCNYLYLLSMKKKLILGTRSSKTAISAAQKVQSLLAKVVTDIDVEIRSFKSEGCKFQGDLKLFGGKGAFIKDLETRLLSNEIDFAIHAVKDIPSNEEPQESLSICSFLPRADPRDVFVLPVDKIFTNWSDFFRKNNVITIGTCAPRRSAFLKAFSPLISVVSLRGNVDTRLEKLDRGEFNAIVVSLAGLTLLNRMNRASCLFSYEEMLPSVGQGMLCLQARSEDSDIIRILRLVNSMESEVAATAERAMARSLNGDCFSALAGYCSVINENSTMQTTLRGVVISPDGEIKISSQKSLVVGSLNYQNTLLEVQALGNEVGDMLLNQGAASILSLQHEHENNLAISMPVLA
jgi:hydroxymethylbilane synthase